MTAIAIFAKAPIPGRVKTRLVPPLTAEEAARVARASIEDTVHRIVPAVDARWTLHVDGSPDPALRTLAREHGLPIVPQRGADLGERLAAAFRELRASGARIVLAIGSDSPTLDPARIREATEALTSRDLALGPTEDGGYYLIGMSGAHEAVFAGIPWSTEHVLARTLERARDLGLAVAMLAPWYDVDDAASLKRVYVERHEAALRGTAGESALDRELDALREKLGFLT